MSTSRFKELGSSSRAVRAANRNWSEAFPSSSRHTSCNGCKTAGTPCDLIKPHCHACRRAARISESPFVSCVYEKTFIPPSSPPPKPPASTSNHLAKPARKRARHAGTPSDESVREESEEEDHEDSKEFLRFVSKNGKRKIGSNAQGQKRGRKRSRRLETEEVDVTQAELRDNYLTRSARRKRSVSEDIEGEWLGPALGNDDKTEDEVNKSGSEGKSLRETKRRRLARSTSEIPLAVLYPLERAVAEGASSARNCRASASTGAPAFEREAECFASSSSSGSNASFGRSSSSDIRTDGDPPSPATSQVTSDATAPSPGASSRQDRSPPRSSPTPSSYPDSSRPLRSDLNVKLTSNFVAPSVAGPQSAMKSSSNRPTSTINSNSPSLIPPSLVPASRLPRSIFGSNANFDFVPPTTAISRASSKSYGSSRTPNQMFIPPSPFVKFDFEEPAFDASAPSSPTIARTPIAPTLFSPSPTRPVFSGSMSSGLQPANDTSNGENVIASHERSEAPANSFSTPSQSLPASTSTHNSVPGFPSVVPPSPSVAGDASLSANATLNGSVSTRLADQGAAVKRVPEEYSRNGKFLRCDGCRKLKKKCSQGAVDPIHRVACEGCEKVSRECVFSPRLSRKRVGPSPSQALNATALPSFSDLVASLPDQEGELSTPSSNTGDGFMSGLRSHAKRAIGFALRRRDPTLSDAVASTSSTIFPLSSKPNSLFGGSLTALSSPSPLNYPPPLGSHQPCPEPSLFPFSTGNLPPLPWLSEGLDLDSSKKKGNLPACDPSSPPKPKIIRAKAPPKPKPPPKPKTPKKVVERPEFTYSKEGWVELEHLKMIEVSPPIILRPDILKQQLLKNPHSERLTGDRMEVDFVNDAGDLVNPDGTVLMTRAELKEQKSAEKAGTKAGTQEGTEKGTTEEEAKPKGNFFTYLIGLFPPIWSLGRQELCEALYRYFNSYQGGHYDKAPGDQCADGGRIIISHGGGCSTITKDAGYQLHMDQERDNVRVRSLINCYENKIPVVLIAGSGYEFFPWLADRKFRHAVLGYYFVKHVWAEAEPIPGDPTSFNIRFKFLFSWMASQGDPWFKDVISSSAEEPAAFSFPSAPNSSFLDRQSQRGVYKCCSSCHEVNFAIYAEDVSCYNEKCQSFFQVNGNIASVNNLHIRPSVLTYQPEDNSYPTTGPCPLTPQGLTDIQPSGSDFSREAWRAYHCSCCGRLSSRSEWTQLACETCGNSIPVPFESTQLPAELSGDSCGLIQKGTVAKSKGIEMTEIDLPDFVGWTYILGPNAKVHHLAPRKPEAFTQADTFYKGYRSEEAAKLLKRNALTLAKIAGENLASQFSFNSGKHYDHVVAVPTYSFDDSPAAVRDACAYLSDVSAKVVENEQDAVFNEVLSVAYSPIVSTLSLGAPGIMRFRRKIKKSKAKKGAAKSSADARAPSTSNLAAPRSQPLPTAEENQHKTDEKNKKEQNFTVLTLDLLHGHVTIMEGADVQSYFEHAITKPKDGLRFGELLPIVEFGPCVER
ncbi:hypothetical protein P7C70_g3831, partial [Phenoliferia sp. Uapishka_3]